MKDTEQEAILRHSNLIQEQAINEFCTCGLPKSQCKKVHKVKLPKREKFSGKSKSKNRFYDYD